MLVNMPRMEKYNPFSRVVKEIRKLRVGSSDLQIYLKLCE